MDLYFLPRLFHRGCKDGFIALTFQNDLHNLKKIPVIVQEQDFLKILHDLLWPGTFKYLSKNGCIPCKWVYS